MNKNIVYVKLILSIIIMLLIFFIFDVATVYASEGATLLQNMQSQASDFINEGSKTKIDYNAIAKEFKGLGQILTMVGTGVMVAVTTYMGIKYLTAGPEAQAKLKVQLIGVVVSGMVIFGSYSIWSLVMNVASQF